eukprot:CAMPEP_0179256804 /NCGR_PEP_ID=MMETSP0797-20121207/24457_1 /TAXON_ID=47934 /ORGANISM="Dinophysis acuminata, Strain DAEP01" /LENGTH=366 /DNA_ID=CAMNT_0020964753 /DNA_START=143 /DNA_END=1240 /DNA_ORIENTATION=+
MRNAPRPREYRLKLLVRADGPVVGLREGLVPVGGLALLLVLLVVVVVIVPGRRVVGLVGVASPIGVTGLPDEVPLRPPREDPVPHACADPQRQCLHHHAALPVPHVQAPYLDQLPGVVQRLGTVQPQQLGEDLGGQPVLQFDGSVQGRLAVRCAPVRIGPGPQQLPERLRVPGLDRALERPAVREPVDPRAVREQRRDDLPRVIGPLEHRRHQEPRGCPDLQPGQAHLQGVAVAVGDGLERGPPHQVRMILGRHLVHAAEADAAQARLQELPQLRGARRGGRPREALLEEVAPDDVGHRQAALRAGQAPLQPSQPAPHADHVAAGHQYHRDLVLVSVGLEADRARAVDSGGTTAIGVAAPTRGMIW